MSLTQLPRILLTLSVAMVIMLGVLFAVIVSAMRDDALLRAQASSQNVLVSVERMLDRTLVYADTALRETSDLLGDKTLGALPAETRRRVLFGSASQVPGLGTVLVINEHGEATAFSKPVPADANFSDRDYFRYFKANADTRTYVSLPFVSRLTGEPSLAISRRLFHPDGSFAGVIASAFTLAYLNDLLPPLDVDTSSGVSLYRTDGGVLLRAAAPSSVDLPSMQGRPAFEHMSRERAGHMVATPALDDVERLYTFRTLSEYPVLITVGMATSTIYADWWRRSVSLGLITLILITGCGGLAYLFSRELGRRRAAGSALRRAQKDLLTILNRVPSMIAYWDRKLINRFANTSYMACFGLSERDTSGRGMSELLTPTLYAESIPYMRRALEGEEQMFERALTDAQGNRRYAITSYIPDVEDGEVQGVFVQLTDITARKAAELGLYEEKEKVRVTLNSIGDAVVTTNVDGVVDYMNPIAERMTGWSLDEARGRMIEEVMDLRSGTFGEPVRNPLREAIGARSIIALSSDCVLIARNGARFDLEDSAAPILASSGKIVGAVMVFHDAGPSREIASRLERLAHYDALTGLPNRILLYDLANQAIMRANRGDHALAVLYIDMDRFKSVNDSLGHDVGDRLLIALAQRLSDAIGASDTLSRQGGDEFVLLAVGYESTETLSALAKHMLERCAAPFAVDDHVLTLSVSIGIARYPLDGNSYVELAKNADTAMYIAKQDGRNRFHYFEQEHGKEAIRRLWIENALKDALARDEFFMVYQPKVSYATAAVVGLEALVRWRKDGKVIPPAEFIPWAEEYGLIGALGQAILRAVAEDMVTMKAGGLPEVPIAVNISAGQFAHPGFHAFVQQTFAPALLAAHALEFEITESVLMQDLCLTVDALRRFRELGIRVAIDDFGTGYSSLSYLKTLPLDVIKLDKSFVDDVAVDRRDSGIAQTVILLAGHLGLEIVAEGVEHTEQADLLSLMGCDRMQGYLFSKPLSLSDLLASRDRFGNWPAAGQ